MGFLREKEKVLIIDFGSQVTKLIARRIRDLGVYSEVITPVEIKNIKSFNSIKGIAEAKAEIIKNISSGGRIILNADDVFYSFFKERAFNRGLKIISFSIKNKSDFQFIDNKKNRIKKIETHNKMFDPNFHQAMSELEDEKKEVGAIIHEIQAGYMLGDRLLRPALVSVAKKKSSKDQENKDKKEEN